MSTLQEAAPSQMPPHAHPPRRHAPERRIAIWGPLLVVTVLALLIIVGAWHHVRQRREQREFQKAAEKLSVNVVPAQRDAKPKQLTLPGNIEAFQEATLYPRTNGYIKKWHVDIGDLVKTGQLLAEIETPEVDQQLAQARANFEIARVTAQRWRELVEKRVVAPQEFDEKVAAYEAAQAAVRQLEQTQAFNQIVAPFDGKITARRVDVGALVSAGSSSTPLFSLAQTDPLRVYIYVPQTNAPSIREGMTAKILSPEKTGREFPGTVMRTAGAIDPASRTMQVQVQVPNPDGALYAGMYGQVVFTLQDENAPIVVPANVLSFRAAGPQAATVNGGKIHWQSVQIGRDFGTTLEVLSGLPENTNVVMNPTDDLQEGVPVEIKPPPPAAPGPAH